MCCHSLHWKIDRFSSQYIRSGRVMLSSLEAWEPTQLPNLSQIPWQVLQGCGLSSNLEGDVYKSIFATEGYNRWNKRSYAWLPWYLPSSGVGLWCTLQCLAQPIAFVSRFPLSKKLHFKLCLLCVLHGNIPVIAQLRISSQIFFHVSFMLRSIMIVA
jgi:hypothetical protein